MSRIAGIELQDNWKVSYALTKIKGIGWTLSERIVRELGLDPKRRISDMSAEEISKLTSEVAKFPTEGDLIRKVRGDISRLQSTGTYRGLRHSHGLPVHGQRTRRNARTKRGKRKTVGAFKKEALAKMTAAKKEGEK